MPYAVPTALKIVRQTLQPCRQPENEPNPAGAPPIEAPEWMTDRQKSIWAAMLEQTPAGLLKAIDTALVVQYVIALDLYEQAAQEVNQNGYTRSGRRGPQVAPAVYVMNAQSVILRQVVQELGFSPAARTRIDSHAGEQGFGAGGGDHWDQIALFAS